MRSILTLLAMTLMLTACANHDYACKGYPEGKRCVSTRDVYYGEGRQSATAKKTKNIDSRNTTGHRVVRDTVVDTFVTPRLPNKPVPIRTPARVMRIWIATWEDESGSLIAPGKVYTEIEPRRWVIGSRPAALRQVRYFKPLNDSPKKENENEDRKP